MPPNSSFTPQQAFNTARRRHPALITAVLTDVELLEDYNMAVDDTVTELMSQNEHPFTQRTAEVALTGADGGVADLQVAEGQIMRIGGMSAYVTAAEKKVVIVDYHRRFTVANEYADDTSKAVCSILFSQLNNRWELYMLTGWTGVTGYRLFAVLKPAEVGSGDLLTQVKLPIHLFLPIVERLALLLGHRATLDDSWLNLQAAAYENAMQKTIKHFANFAGDYSAVPAPHQPRATAPAILRGS